MPDRSCDKMECCRLLGATLAVWLVVSISSGDAVANSARQCSKLTVGAHGGGATESIARSQLRVVWSNRVRGRLGHGWDSWTSAKHKQVNCMVGPRRPGTPPNVLCRGSATPCRIVRY